MQSTIDKPESPIALRSAPGTSTARQRSALVLAGKRRGMSLDEVRSMVGGSVSALSAKDASRWLTILTHRDLPNPPGGKPGPYKRRPRFGRNPDRDGGARFVARVITPDHIEQIGRLMLRYFAGNVLAAQQWFRKTWHVQEPADLLDTEKAGKVIAVLKTMLKRGTARPLPLPTGRDATKEGVSRFPVTEGSRPASAPVLDGGAK